MFTGWNDLTKVFETMDLLRRRLDSPFFRTGRPYPDDPGWTATQNMPWLNLYDTGNSLQVTAEIPGISKKDINVKIQGNYLEISGSSTPEFPKGYKAQRQERNTARFSRSITLPTDVNADKAEAVLKDGILTLTMPKTEAAKPREITVN